ncbi:MAG: DivIVA domain-containing protein [Nocardioidaceae bacterium]
MSIDTGTISQFRGTRLRPGYRRHEVDEFIESVEEALRARTPQVSSGEVAWQRFTTVMMWPGYHKDDVDDYLTEAEHQLEERERFQLPARPPH